MKKESKKNNHSSTGHMDEGFNETTRLQYTDSISTQASDEVIGKNKNKKRSR